MLLPLCPFPPVHWLLLAISNTPCSINIHEHYIKQSYRNRYDLLGVNGRTSLTLPVQGQKGQKVMIKDILLEQSNWRKQHLATIRSAYGRAAYFEHYMDELEQIFLPPHRTLADFSLASVQFTQRHIPLLQVSIADQPVPFNVLSAREQEWMNQFEPSYAWKELPYYPQVFSDRFAFQSNLSSLDLLMNLGPRAVDYLLLIKSSEQSS